MTIMIGIILGQYAEIQDRFMTITTDYLVHFAEIQDRFMTITI